MEFLPSSSTSLVNVINPLAQREHGKSMNPEGESE